MNEEEEEEAPVSLREKEEDGGNGGEQLEPKKQVDKEELRMKTLAIDIAHRETLEEGRDKGIIPNNHKGVTWNEKDNRKEKDTTDTSLMNVEPERHASKEVKFLRAPGNRGK